MKVVPLRGKYRNNVYVELDEYMEIHVWCHSRQEMVIGKFDKSDFSKVDLFTWSAHYAPTTKSYYLESTLQGQTTRIVGIRMHRMLMQEPPKTMVVDHFNRDTTDNRRFNLRVISKGGNTQNVGVQANNKSGIRGVSWHVKNRKWLVCIRVNSKTKHIGYYEDIREAEQASIQARAKYMPYSQEALSS